MFLVLSNLAANKKGARSCSFVFLYCFLFLKLVTNVKTQVQTFSIG